MKRFWLKSLIFFLMVLTALSLVAGFYAFTGCLIIDSVEDEKNFSGSFITGVVTVFCGWCLWKGFRLFKKLGVKDSEGTWGKLGGWDRGDFVTIGCLIFIAMVFLAIVFLICTFDLSHLTFGK